MIEQTIEADIRTPVIIHQHIKRRILTILHCRTNKGSTLRTCHHADRIGILVCPALNIVPLIEELLSLGVTILIQKGLYLMGILHIDSRVSNINMPCKEIKRHIPTLHLRQDPLIPYRNHSICRRAAGHGRTTYQQMRETTLKMLYSNLKEIIELLRRTCPATRIHLPFVIIPLKVRLIPDLPVADVPMVAVCPSLVIMTDDVLCYHRPLLIILWRVNVILLKRLILNALTKTIENLHACILNTFHISVGQNEIV